VNKFGSSKESEVFGDSEKTLRPLRFARFVPCFNCCRSTTRRCQQKTRNFGFGENQHGSVWECSKGTLLVQVERSTRNCLRCFGAYCRGVSVVCGVVCVFFAKGFVDFGYSLSLVIHFDVFRLLHFRHDLKRDPDHKYQNSLTWACFPQKKTYVFEFFRFLATTCCC